MTHVTIAPHVLVRNIHPSVWRDCLETLNVLDFMVPREPARQANGHVFGRFVLPTDGRSDPSSYFPDSLLIGFLGSS